MKTSLSSDCLVAFKLPVHHRQTLDRAATAQDMSLSQILRKAVREFIGLYELEKESPGSVIDLPADWKRRQ